RLTEGDAEALREATSVSDVTVFSSVSAQVIAGDKNTNTQVMGVSTTYWRVRAFTFSKGEGFTDHEAAIKARVVILGKTVTENLFGNQDPVGAFIRIGRHA